MDNLNFVVAKNLAELRKKNKLTQLELAEKLNYSDKAVSKWEQGESLPGIEVLYKISKLYGVSLDYLVGEDHKKAPKINDKQLGRKHFIISLLSVLVVWLTATVFYIAFSIFGGKSFWIFYCWALPASFIVSIVFNAIWGKKMLTFVFVSLLFWSILLCFCIQFMQFNIWVLMLAGIPLQIATLLWARLVK